MIRNVSMTFCLIVTIVFIWIWHHQSQFNDHSRKAFFHLRNGELEPAIESYTKAIAYKKRTLFFAHAPSAYNNLGQAYLRKAEYDRAISAFQTVLEIQPNAVEPYINLTTAYLKQNSPNQAIASCAKALQISPHVALVHYNLACAYALKKENEKSIGALRRAIDLDKQMEAFAKEESVFDELRSHPLFPSE